MHSGTESVTSDLEENVEEPRVTVLHKERRTRQESPPYHGASLFMTRWKAGDLHSFSNSGELTSRGLTKCSHLMNCLGSLICSLWNCGVCGTLLRY